MKYSINNNTLIINIDTNISSLNKIDIINITLLIYTIRKIELNKGNEFDNPYLEIKYYTNMLITEYINIVNICRKYSIYEIIEYFKNFKEKFSTQNNDTTMYLDDYIIQEENISQKIVITFMCNIRHSLSEIDEIKKKYGEILNLNEIYDMIK